MSMHKDPLLSGAMNTSPMKGSPLSAGGGGMGVFGSQPTPQAMSGMALKMPEDGLSVMVTDQSQAEVSSDYSADTVL